MKQREICVRDEWSQQRGVPGLYFVHSRLAHGFFGLLAVAGAVAAVSVIASATAAHATVFSATRRSAAVGVECIDVHLRVRRAVNDAGASARHRSCVRRQRGFDPSACQPTDHARTGVRMRL
jgi:hypothetical protein